MNPLTLMEPMFRERPFTNAGWVFELPSSGYRMVADFGGGAMRLLSMLGTDVRQWFPEVTEALANVEAGGRSIVDGELCVLDQAGCNDAARLHERALIRGYRPGCSRVVLCVRDLLMHAGQDVRSRPWRERRVLLQSMVTDEEAGMCVPRVVAREGDWLHRQAEALGRPAIHARRIDGAYVGGRSSDWLVIPAVPGFSSALCEP